MRKLIPALLLLLLAATACRRPLYVAGEDMFNAVLHTDWSAYQSKDPDGMTAWFFPADDSQKSYRYTSANVRNFKFNVPSGTYTAVVIDYSPAEYGKQEFVDMDYASTALVQATISGSQPDSLKELYGPGCWRDAIGSVRPETGLYEVSNQPEPMALDTLHDMRVKSGKYGYYIPYEERDTYQAEIEVQDFYSRPVTPIWELRIRVFVKGFPMLYEIEGSVAGLAHGRYLGQNLPSSTPCLISLTDWSTMQTGENEGYINVTLKTFGLMAGLRPHQIVDTKAEEGTIPTKQSAVMANWANTALLSPDDIRLNLRLRLRDHATICNYHFDVGEQIISYDNQLVLYVTLDRNFPGIPDLPYVEPYNSAGFDAEVTPWEDVGDVDITM